MFKDGILARKSLPFLYNNEVISLIIMYYDSSNINSVDAKKEITIERIIIKYVWLMNDQVKNVKKCNYRAKSRLKYGNSES